MVHLQSTMNVSFPRNGSHVDKYIFKLIWSDGKEYEHIGNDITPDDLAKITLDTFTFDMQRRGNEATYELYEDGTNILVDKGIAVAEKYGAIPPVKMEYNVRTEYEQYRGQR